MNVSVTYMFPIIFYNLYNKNIEEWDILKYIKNTYLIDVETNSEFVIIFKKDLPEEIKNKINTSELAEIIETENEIRVFLILKTEEIETKTKLITGKFSEIKEKHKKIILRFVFNNDNSNLKLYEKVKGILFKEKKYREKLLTSLMINDEDVPKDIELRSKISIPDETYINEYEYERKNKDNKTIQQSHRRSS